MSVESWPIDTAVRVLGNGRTLQYSTEVQHRVDRLWLASLARNPTLFDGRLLSFVERREHEIVGRFVPYRFYMAQRQDPSLRLDLQIVPLSVSGILVAGDSVAFGRRGADVTQYAGFLELIPSGGVNDSNLRSDGSIDYRRQLLQELAEETQIEETAVRLVDPLLMVRDHNDDCFDLCAVIEIDSGAGVAAAAGITRTAEYSEIRWIPIEQLLDFVHEHERVLVPTTMAIVEAFLRRLAASPRPGMAP